MTQDGTNGTIADNAALRNLFMREFERYVMKYAEANGIPVPLNILNRRWGARCREALGISPRQLVETSPRFETMIGLNGGLLVRLRGRDPLARMIIAHLTSAGRPLTDDELLSQLRGSGYTFDQFMQQSVELTEAGLISIEGGTYRLTEQK